MIETSILTWAPNQPIVADDQFQAIIDRCLQGDDTAYVQLYRTCAPMIYRLNMSLLGNVEDAEEVLQDSFEYAFRRLETFDANKSAFKTWLYRIAISRCRNKRRRKWLPTMPLLTPSGDDREIVDRNTPSPDDLLNLSEEQQRVWQAIQQLSDKLREVALLRYYEEMRYPEIGAILGISPKTVESRMRLAHKKLKLLLEEA